MLDSKEFDMGKAAIKTTGKIVIFSDLFMTTFPTLEIPLFHELIRLGTKTIFVLQEGDYRLVDKELSEIFASIATIVKNPKKDLPNMVEKDDLCVMRFTYKGTGGDTAAAIRSKGSKLLMLDPAAIDIRVRECPAQYITTKSEWMKNQVLKKFPGRYKDIFPVGTIHFDQAAIINSSILDKKEFLRSYDLDDNKKLAILTPSNPAEPGHQKGIGDEYSQIIKIVQAKCPEYNLMVKGHPMDYTACLPACPGIIHKNQHYGNKCSWETFAPGVKIVRPKEGYTSFKLADVVLNVRSSIAMETPFFPTPIINVNRNKYTTNWPDSKDPGVMKDIVIEKLSDTLNNNDYCVDADACKKYVLQYCDPKADGKAYERTAEIAVKLLEKK